MKANAPHQLKSGGNFIAFLILSGISTAILLAGLVLGTEPRLVMERVGEREFRVTASNHFAGKQFHSKTIEGVHEVVEDNAVREGNRDSAKEVRRRRKQRHLDFFGHDGARVGWDRESDQRLIEEFMRGTEAKLELTEPPPVWRMAIAWFCLVLGGLALVGAVRNSFFPSKNNQLSKS